MQGAHIAHYYLQVGAFSTQRTAALLQTKLKHLTSSPVFIEHYKQHYVVRIGPFVNKRVTDQVKTILLQRGVNGMFVVLI